MVRHNGPEATRRKTLRYGARRADHLRSSGYACLLADVLAGVADLQVGIAPVSGDARRVPMRDRARVTDIEGAGLGAIALGFSGLTGGECRRRYDGNNSSEDGKERLHGLSGDGLIGKWESTG